jgi:hypothetical protein
MNASTKRLVNGKRNILALLCATPLLTACYVVPVHPDGRVYPPSGSGAGQSAVMVTPAQLAIAPAPVVFTARLYPANETASRTGIIAGSVTSPQDGKGVFTIPYNGDTLSGEATRTSAGNLHSGIANAAGPRGQFVRCNYRMNSTTQGTGECLFSDGARFQMHVGG